MTTMALDQALLAAVVARRPLIDHTVRFINAHPELAHEEHACSAHLRQALSTLGLDVEAGLAGMETGFRATLLGGRPGRSVGIVALYDAVPSVTPAGGIAAVHSCGHGQISGGVVGALAALATVQGELPGRVVVMGCPADEIHAPGTVAYGSGKARSADAGAWDGIDAALYAHLEPVDTAWSRTAWMRRDTAVISGTRALDDAAPQPVLAGVVAAVNAAGAHPRATVMLEQLSLDGDVEEGGGLVARAQFLIWSVDEAGLASLADQLRVALPATWSEGPVVPGIVADPFVTQTVLEALRAAGRTPDEHPGPLPFATDFGSVTRRVPASLVGVGRAGGWAFHTPLGEQQFASDEGIAAASDIADVLALAAIRLTSPGR
jgi:metal-dependent amidase/aminoacylase/carboxypeptidase family protein